MLIEKIKEFSKKTGSKFDFDYDLKKSNWFNIGGKTRVFYKPENLKQLVEFLKNFGEKEKIFILGAGSNTLISDKIFNGIVIKLGKNFGNLSFKNEISGMEFLSCIPGTVGGGLKMNAGCFNKEFKDILVSIQAVDKVGKIITIPSNKIQFEYRNNNLTEDLIFLSASFKGKKKNKLQIENEMKQLKIDKDKAQPTKIKTSGSTFKNPIKQTKLKVWELIKESVPINTSFGDACISDKHCNFFINKKNASFDDMKKLIEFVEKSVEKKTGIKLEREIKILE